MTNSGGGDGGTGLPSLPEKYPRKQKEGPKMDYSSVAFPKPKPKKKRKK